MWLEYIWVENNSLKSQILNLSFYNDICKYSKSKTFDVVEFKEKIPKIKVKNSVNLNDESILLPKSVFNNPFSEDGFLVFCETFIDLKNNFHILQEKGLKFSFQQDYMFLNHNKDYDLNFKFKNSYYCENGFENVWFREIYEDFLYNCCFAKLNILQCNVHHNLGQATFKITGDANIICDH